MDVIYKLGNLAEFGPLSHDLLVFQGFNLQSDT